MSMNISFNSTKLYWNAYKPENSGDASVYARDNAQTQKNNAIGASFASKAVSALEEKNRSIRDYQEMRRLKRGLQSNTEQSKSEEEKPLSLVDTLLSKDDEEDAEKVQKPVNYNYKEVSNKIQRAKTSVSAEQAYLSAKRKTLQIKRKIAAEEGDPEELQMALTHARSMELVARKKKHHLELEEMVERTQRHDEAEEKTEEAAESVKGMLIGNSEEKLTEREDEILDKRQSMMEETAEELRESGAGSAEEMLSELNKMLADMGEKELEELEQAMMEAEPYEEQIKVLNAKPEEKDIPKASVESVKEKSVSEPSLLVNYAYHLEFDNPPNWGSIFSMLYNMPLPKTGRITIDVESKHEEEKKTIGYLQETK